MITYNCNEPASALITGHGEIYYGLTKREYFAVVAMQGWLAGRDPQYDYDFEDIARWSVENADALLKQLEK